MAPNNIKSKRKRKRRERKKYPCKLKSITFKKYHGARKFFQKFIFLFYIMEYGSRIIYNLGCNAPGMGNSGYKQVISTMMSSLSTLFEVIIEIFSPLWASLVERSSHRYKHTQRYKHIYGQALIKYLQHVPSSLWGILWH